MSITSERLQKIIGHSGNSFHCKVIKFLRENGWEVLVSPYYNDVFSNKPREIDLIAEKAVNWKERFGGSFGTIYIRLYIECKYVPNPTVFWFDAKDKYRANKLVIQNTPLRDNNIYTQKHHYLGAINHVAKIWADERNKSSENEIFYKALSQSLNATIYYRTINNQICSPPKRSHGAITFLHYPVIACSNFNLLYRVDIDSDESPSNVKDNFLLEVNYAYADFNGVQNCEYFLMDVVSFNLFQQYLEQLEKDVNLVKSMFECV